MSFHERITAQLQPLNREQLCLFAWLCGLRALPVLSVGRRFCYWKEDERQKHLYSIFYALDACAGVWGLNTADVFAISSAADIAANAAKDAAAAAANNIAAKAAKNAVWVAWTASDVASAAAWVARTASSAEANPDAAVNAAAWAFRASSHGNRINEPERFASSSAFWGPGAFTRIGTNDIFGNTINNDIRVIFNSIAAIKSNDLTALNKDTSIYGAMWNNFLEDTSNTGIYGVVWNNFLEDLDKAGCGYWGRLYKELFKNKFILKDRFALDEKELARRLFGVPDEIKAEGAAAVGLYLENDP
ncbi:MAG: hypothetical protein FWG06_03630 [Clostridiales bacterium]|nr:hypothetical protein [Clostridiales bacterium]